MAMGRQGSGRPKVSVIGAGMVGGAVARVGVPASALIVPHALLTLPILAGS